MGLTAPNTPGAVRQPGAGGLVRVSGPSRIAETLIESLSSLRIPGEALPVLDVTVAPDGRAADGEIDGRLIWSIALSPAAPIVTLLGEIAGTLTTFLTRLLFIHAGVVAVGGRGMVLVGHSGAGKTSTVAALVRRGAAFLSDEVALLDPSTGVVMPFALPMAVKPWTRRAAGPLPPGRRITREGRIEFWLPRRLGGTVQLDTVVLLRRQEASACLSPLSRAAMLLALAEHASSFKQQHRIREAFSGFARLLRSARCVAFDAARPAAHADLLMPPGNRRA